MTSTLSSSVAALANGSGSTDALDCSSFDPLVSNKLFDHLRDVAQRSEQVVEIDRKKQQEDAETVYELLANKVGQVLSAALEEPAWRNALEERSKARMRTLPLDKETIGAWPHGQDLLSILAQMPVIPVYGFADAIDVATVRAAVARRVEQSLAPHFGRSRLETSPAWQLSWS